MPNAIELTDVSVAYRLSHVAPRSLKTLPTAMLRRRLRHELHWALSRVSFAVPRGEVLALVGANGAGKSTLLRLLARVFRPSSGRVVVRGAVSPLVDLGSGFDLEATARDNVILYGALLGRSPRAMRAEAPKILEWAGLSDYSDIPVAAFSSGMQARLAFATATAATPQVLLIDEVLGVGDAAFQQRSADRIRELAATGCTVVVASHSVEQLRPLAARAVWLHEGEVRGDGPFDPVVERYLGAPAGGITTRSEEQ